MMQLEETMRKLLEFSQNHHPCGAKLLAKNVRRGISVGEEYEHFE